MSSVSDNWADITTPKAWKPLSLDAFYSSAYSPAALSSFHPDKVRKIALSGLDPSMLVGFVIQNEQDWDDWKERSREMKPPLYSVAKSVPTWVRRASPAPRTVSTSSAAPAAAEAAIESDSEDSSHCDWDISDSENGFVDAAEEQGHSEEGHEALDTSGETLGRP